MCLYICSLLVCCGLVFLFFSQTPSSLATHRPHYLVDSSRFSAYFELELESRYPVENNILEPGQMMTSLPVPIDPSRHRCHCNKSVILPRHPKIHCPKCHATYTARTLDYPVHCARCNYNLYRWRQRNAIEELDVPFA